MSEPEQRPASDRHAAEPRRVSRPLVRNLAIVFVIIAVGYGFGRPLAAGYYFGGCDDAVDVQQYAIHVFGIPMCRDVTLTSKAETNAQGESEATSATELFEGEGAGPPEEEGAGGAGAPQGSTAPPAAAGRGRS
jgi:hypothetical protein